MLSICLNNPSELTGSEAFPAPSGHLGRHKNVRSLILSPAQGQRHRTIPGHPWLWKHPHSSAEMFIYGTALSLGVSTGSGILWDALWAWNILYSVFSVLQRAQGFRSSGRASVPPWSCGECSAQTAQHHRGAPGVPWLPSHVWDVTASEPASKHPSACLPA